MKKMFLILTLILIATTAYAKVEQKPQKFEGVFKITYNTVTLEEAAKIEERIKNEHKDACKVVVEVNKTSDNVLSMRLTSVDGASY